MFRIILWSLGCFLLVNFASVPKIEGSTALPFDCRAILDSLQESDQAHRLAPDRRNAWLTAMAGQLASATDSGTRRFRTLALEAPNDLVVEIFEGRDAERKITQLAELSDRIRIGWTQSLTDGDFSARSRMALSELYPMKNQFILLSSIGAALSLAALHLRSGPLLAGGMIFFAGGSMGLKWVKRRLHLFTGLAERARKRYERATSTFTHFDRGTDSFHLYQPAERESVGDFGLPQGDVHLFYYLGATTGTPHLALVAPLEDVTAVND